MNELLILGMGNKFFGDDGVGIIIAEKFKELFSKECRVDVDETNWGGFRIIDKLTGYESVIIVDAINTSKHPIGFVRWLDYHSVINSVRMISFHDINFATALEFAKKINIPMPKKIKILGVEVGETNRFQEFLSNEVEGCIEQCMDMIFEEIELQLSIKNKKFN